MKEKIIKTIEQELKEKIDKFHSNPEQILFESYYNDCVKDISTLTGIDENKIKKFMEIQMNCLKIFLLKNMKYKDSYKKHGIFGMIIRISDKIDRLFNMEMEGMKQNFIILDDESKEDTFYDIANYSILSLMELKERNK